MAFSSWYNKQLHTFLFYSTFKKKYNYSINNKYKNEISRISILLTTDRWIDKMLPGVIKVAKFNFYIKFKKRT